MSKLVSKKVESSEPEGSFWMIGIGRLSALATCKEHILAPQIQFGK